MIKPIHVTSALLAVIIGIGCSKTKQSTTQDLYPGMTAAFGSNINLSNLANYAAQTKPGYITKDNSDGNTITNVGEAIKHLPVFLS